MQKMKRTVVAILGKIIAGCILVSTLLHWQMAAVIISPWTRINLVTAVWSLPIFVLYLVGSGALLLRRRWGYYCIYASLPFLAFGTGIPFVPFLFYFTRPLCDMNPFVMSTIILVATNLLVAGLLIWVHVVEHRESRSGGRGVTKRRARGQAFDDKKGLCGGR